MGAAGLYMTSTLSYYIPPPLKELTTLLIGALQTNKRYRKLSKPPIKQSLTPRQKDLDYMPNSGLPIVDLAYPKESGDLSLPVRMVVLSWTSRISRAGRSEVTVIFGLGIINLDTLSIAMASAGSFL
jgi:hypothetical protein